MPNGEGFRGRGHHARTEETLDSVGSTLTRPGIVATSGGDSAGGGNIGGGGVPQGANGTKNDETTMLTSASSSKTTQYGGATSSDAVPGMRRRSSIVNSAGSDNPLFSVPASRQKSPIVVPTSTASGANLRAPVQILHDPRSPIPRSLKPSAVPIPFQSTFLHTFEEGSTTESEPGSITSSPGIPEQPGLMSMSPQDLRRPSFEDTIATTSSRSKPALTPSSFVKALLSWSFSRRLRRVIRMWILALIALVVTIKSIEYVLPRLRASPQVREFFDQPPAPVKDVLKEQMRQVAESIPRPQARVESVQGGAEGGTNGQVSFGLTPVNDREEHLASTRIQSLETVAKFRQDYLWKAPEEDVWVQFANPNKGQPHESTIIFLHGMTQKAGEAFLPVNMHKDYTSTRWVLPQANNRTLVSTGQISPSWFDLALPYDPTSANGRLPHLFASVRIVNQIIRAERALLILRRREALAAGGHSTWKSEGPRPGLVYTASHGPDAEGRGAGPVPVEPGFLESFGTDEERRWASKRIVLAGFSQGAVLSLMTALSGRYPLGGVAVFSGFLPMRSELPKLIADLDTKNVPIFWGHGSEDHILTLDDAIASVNLLRHQSLIDFFAPLKNLPENFTLPSAPPGSSSVGLNDVTFRVYPMLQHSWCHDEVKDVKRWIKRIIPTGLEGKNGKNKWL